MNWTWLTKIFQVKLSFLGWKANKEIVIGKPEADYKLLEGSIAVLTIGIRLTVRV